MNISFAGTVLVPVYHSPTIRGVDDVVALLNSDQDYIRFEAAGKVSMPRSGNEPYSPDSLARVDSRLSEARDFTVALDDVILSHPIHKYKKYAIVSRHGLTLSSAKVADIPALAYLSLLSLVIDSHPHEKAVRQEFPYGVKSPLQWEAYIRDGRLPVTEESRLSESASENEHVQRFVDVCNTILKSISVRAKALSGEQGQPSGEKVQETSSVKSDSDISDPALTGRFGVSADSERPDDALDYRAYAKALASIICDKDTETPLTIGICAPWGRGKSVLMGYIEDEINKLNDVVKRSWKPFDLEHRRAKVIQFNAWEYSKAEQIWAGFMDVVLRQLEADIGSWWRKLSLAWKLNKQYRLPEVYHFAWFAAAVILLAFLIPVLQNYELPSYTLLGIGAWGIYRRLFSGIGKLATHPVTEKVLRLSKLPDYKSRLDPIHQIVSHLKTITAEYRTLPLPREVERFVILIDDLDRCHPEKIMETLEAIKHLLPFDRFVFVLAMDSRVVRHAIGQHYKFMSDTKHGREEMGRFYLEKMIQLPFHLSELDEMQRRRLTNHALSRCVQLKTVTATAGMPIEHNTRVSTSGTLIHTAKPVTNHSSIETAPSKVSPKESENERKPRMTAEETDLVYDTLAWPGLSMSPRLLTRFVTIYMVARHLYLTKRAQDTPPDATFVCWLALSVQYPFETSALTRWLDANGWKKPFPELSGLDGKVAFKERKQDKDTPADIVFAGLDQEQVQAFAALYQAMGIPVSEIKDTHHITSCFNMVLD